MDKVYGTGNDVKKQITLDDLFCEQAASERHNKNRNESYDKNDNNKKQCMKSQNKDRI